MTNRIKSIIIGAGQAGLAMGYHLSNRDQPYIILEKEDVMASAWRQRWDSFTLVTPNWTLNMPDFPYQEDDPDGYLARDEIVTYLESFAATYGPPIQYGTLVEKLELKGGSEGFLLTTTEGVIEADNIIVATGAFQKPKLPPLGRELLPDIFQLHTSQYRSPEALPEGAVLVVGSGQSGCQIAEELYQSGRKVYLSVGSTGRAPRRYRGKDTVFWMKELGLFDRTVDKLPSPKARFASNPHVSGKGGGRTLNLHQFARDGVILLGHLKGVQGNRIFLAPDLRESLAASDKFANDLTKDIDEYIEAHGVEAEQKPLDTELRDGYEAELLSDLDLKAAGIQTIIWATGYRADFSWIKMNIFDEFGYPLHERGVTIVPGLYFLGLLWLHTSGSSLLTGVGDDAAHIAQVITNSEN